MKREIFAADFRDRVVRGDSYSCRVGKGTHMGIRRVKRFMRRCSRSYTRDRYILKLDVQGFSMNIDRGILYRRLEAFVGEKYGAPDRGPRPCAGPLPQGRLQRPGP